MLHRACSAILQGDDVEIVVDGSPPRCAPPAAGASAGLACSLSDSDGQPLPGRTSTVRRGQAQVLQSPDSSAPQAQSDSPSAELSSRKRKVCGRAHESSLQH